MAQDWREIGNKILQYREEGFSIWGGGVPQYMSFNETKKILAGGAVD